MHFWSDINLFISSAISVRNLRMSSSALISFDFDYGSSNRLERLVGTDIGGGVGYVDRCRPDGWNCDTASFTY